jgi:uncharacterized protein YdeI (YjbR/CyaY-like superfamily)
MTDLSNSYTPKSRADWRKWLMKNHESSDNIWLVLNNKSSDQYNLSYSEAVDEALCFGWIDSIAKRKDESSRYQYFAKRKPKSNWSKVNKQKVVKLTEEGLMMPAGQRMIDLAKTTGTWDALNEVDALIEPEDLLKLFNKNKTAYDNWKTFSNSSRRGILEWLMNAKKEETRAKRLSEIIEKAAIGKRVIFDK